MFVFRFEFAIASFTLVVNVCVCVQLTEIGLHRVETEKKQATEFSLPRNMGGNYPSKKKTIIVRIETHYGGECKISNIFQPHRPNCPLCVFFGFLF